MRDRTAISTVRALNRIERRFGALFPRVFQTITVDNGGEFSDVKSLNGLSYGKADEPKCIIATRTQVANAGQMSVQTK